MKIIPQITSDTYVFIHIFNKESFGK